MRIKVVCVSSGSWQRWSRANRERLEGRWDGGGFGGAALDDVDATVIDGTEAINSAAMKAGMPARETTMV